MDKERRKQFEQKRHAVLAGWEKDLDVLKAKTKAADAKARKRMTEEVADLEDQLGKAKRKLKEVGEASDDAWDLLTDSFDSVWDQIEEAFKKIISTP